MKALTPRIKKTIFILFFTILPCVVLGQKTKHSIDSAAVSWVMNYYQEACDFWSLSNEKDIAYYKNQYQTHCVHIFQLGKQKYDTVTVFIYTVGMNMSDIGFDKLLVQKKYKDGHSQFEFMWDNPKNIDQIVKMFDFFDRYKGFSKSTQLECVERVVHIYKYSGGYNR